MAGTGTFRIFVSSTFDDLRTERNALQRFVFPRLRELCTSEGASFQEIDLRWGVSVEAGVDQRTMPICLREIDRCLDTTPKPNFIALLGDRYGWRPLPYEIPVKELEAMKFDASEQTIVDAWYRRDENALDPVYILLPRAGKLAPADRRWDADEQPLRAALTRECAGLPLPAQERYLASATAQEIAHAARVDEPRDHIFAFFRRITIGGEPLAQALPADGSADRYVDLLDGRVLDSDAETRLGSLKGDLSSQFESRRYEAEWNPDAPAQDGRDEGELGAPTQDHIGSLPEDLDDCVALLSDPNAKGTLCLDVWRALATAISDEIEAAKGKPKPSESALHRLFAVERSKDSVRRDDVLPRIASYPQESEEERLIAVSGDAGSGKTTLLAQAFLDAVQAHGGVDDQADDAQAAELDATILVRFIGGATPGSSDARSLLADLCQVLGAIVGSEEAVPAEFHKLVAHFSDLLARAGEVKPVILFLDALDQLSDAYAARSLSWLPAKVPGGVRIVVSTRATERRPAREGEERETRPAETLVALERKFPKPVIVPLGKLERPEAEGLLRHWLDKDGRTLQSPPQWEHVLECFDETGMPLHLRLAFEEARLWRSYEGIPKPLGKSIEALIRDNLFPRLDDPLHHDPEVVERALGYFTASQHGLSEDELIDILTRDDDLYDHVREQARQELPSDPDDPARRLPVVFWSRLYFDLAPYLTTRAAEAVDVLGFYHRELTEVARSRYLERDDGPRERNRALASYFRHRADPDGDREWRSYPRGLAELPYHLTEAARTEDEEARDELYHVLTDFRFIERKVADVGVVRSTGPDETETVSHSGVFELQEDYERALELFPGQVGEPGLGPLIVTGWERGDKLTVRCPACNEESRIGRKQLGKVIDCPECGRKLRLNTFTITPAWS